MRLQILISAALLALVASAFDAKQAREGALITGYPPMLAASSAFGLIASPADAGLRIAALERARGPRLAALPSNAPAFLDVNGGQNLRPLATYFSYERRYR